MTEKTPSGRGKNPRSAAKRFKSGGPSANPKGRPKGSKNRNTIIRKVLNQVVAGDIEGRQKRVTVTEASLLRLSQLALQGNLQAIHSILALWKESEDAIAAEREADYPYSEADRQVIDDVYARMKDCEK